MNDDAMDYIEQEYKEDCTLSCMDCSWEGIPVKTYMELFDSYALMCGNCGAFLDYDSQEDYEEEDEGE